MGDSGQHNDRAPHDCYMDSCGASTMPGVACGGCCSCRGVCVHEGPSSDTEQEGVSPAKAGGASAPEVRHTVLRRGRSYGEEAIQAMVPAIRRVAQRHDRSDLELNWYDMAANAFNAVWSYCEQFAEPGPHDVEPRQLREIANSLHALLGEEDCPGVPSMAHVRDLFRFVERHLDAISDGNRRGPQKPDARDAEIERLRGALRSAQQQIVQFEQQRDEAREEWKRADAEVTRLRKKLGIPSETALRGLADQLHAAEENDPCGLPEVTIDHVRTLINCVASTSAEYRAECTRLSVENTSVKAERDRLRATLDRIAEQAVDGYIAEQNKGVCPCKFQCDYNVLENRCSDRCRCDLGPAKPAEPRRWVAGDDEPAVGTTVTWGAGNVSWSRCEDGDWRSDACLCSQCLDADGLPWPTLLEHAKELVEVVSTDG